MIVIKVELHSAVTGEVKQIVEGKIWNVGGDADDGVYAASFEVDSHKPHCLPRPPRHFGSYADDIRHQRFDHVWKLVARALEKAFP